ncbi:MAG: hypothetical protein JWQ79_25 [Mucilaginibacter sp.]|jgi:uncharacterized membrane protein|nr:hypothetical protein [Mucilaginibacter sp.]
MAKTEEDDQQLKSELGFTKTPADHFAVAIANLFGSLTFLVGCISFFVVWIAWNLRLLPGLNPFDPFPFPILEMTVSLFAIILSVSVLINQNRQGKIDKIRQQVDFEVNVRAENEVTKILNMMHDIHRHLGLNTKDDKELEQMKEQTDLSQIHHKLDDKDGNTE